MSYKKKLKAVGGMLGLVPRSDWPNTFVLNPKL